MHGMTMNALRLLYLSGLFVGGVFLLIPDLGVYTKIADVLGGPDELHRVVGGVTLLSLFVLLQRSERLRRDQAHLARKLLQLSPELRFLPAVRILVQALSSDKETVVTHAHRELVRLTGAQLEADPKLWQEWLRSQEGKVPQVLQQALKV